MRTVEHARATDHLGRYYTHGEISQLLIELLPNPSRCYRIGRLVQSTQLFVIRLSWFPGGARNTVIY